MSEHEGQCSNEDPCNACLNSLSEPTTKAGRALDDRLAYDTEPGRYLPGDFFPRYREAILAIEREAAAAERARLRAAVETMPHASYSARRKLGRAVSREAVLDLLAEPKP